MANKVKVAALFSCILASMIVYTVWASTQQSVLHWRGMTEGPDRFWTIATMLDAYFGFLTFYVWVLFKERRWLSRLVWFVAIMVFGNMAMSAYILLQLLRQPPAVPASHILFSQNH